MTKIGHWGSDRMKRILGGIILAIVLTGCSIVDKKVTVQPYELKEKEEQLVSHTHVDFIEYFTLNGKPDGLDIKYSVEVYEKGEFVDELFQSQGLVEENYEDELFSFGLSNKELIELFMSTGGGAMSTEYDGVEDDDQFGSTSGILINGKIELVKDEPIYLAAWATTNGSDISSIQSEQGELPENLDRYDRVFLFKIELLDPNPEYQ